MQRGSFFGVNYLLVILFFTAVAITGLASFQSFARRKGIERKLLIDWYLIAWAVFAYLGAAYSGRHFGHYYIITLAPLSIICATTVGALFDAAGSSMMPDIHRPAPFAVNKSIIEIFIILTILYGLFAPLQRYANRINQWEELRKIDIAVRDAAIPRYRLSKYIKSNSSRQEKIFVWGFYPEIYVLAERMPATRYTNCNYLTGMIPWTNWRLGVDTSHTIVPGAWKIFMEDMQRNKPKYIVDTSVGDVNYYAKYPPEKFAPLYTFLQDNYKISKIFFQEDGMPYVRLWERIN